MNAQFNVSKFQNFKFPKSVAHVYSKIPISDLLRFPERRCSTIHFDFYCFPLGGPDVSEIINNWFWDPWTRPSSPNNEQMITFRNVYNES